MKISIGTAAVICTLAFVPASIRAEEDISRNFSLQYKECVKHAGLADFKMRYCSQDENVRQDIKLNSIYKKLLLTISDSGRKAALVKSERSWINYRRDECGYIDAYTDSPPGTLDELNYADCMLDMTYKRAKELSDDLSVEIEYGDESDTPTKAPKRH